MIYLYLFGTCFHFIYVFMIIDKERNRTNTYKNLSKKVTFAETRFRFGSTRIIETICRSPASDGAGHLTEKRYVPQYIPKGTEWLGSGNDDRLSFYERKGELCVRVERPRGSRLFLSRLDATYRQQ